MKSAFLTFVLVLLIGCASPEMPTSPPPSHFDELSVASVSGCYSLHVGTWSDSTEKPAPSYRLPSVIALTNEETDKPPWLVGNGRFAQLYRVTAPGSTEARRGSWHLKSSNSVSLNWSDGFEGWSADATREHGSKDLTGAVRTFTCTGANQYEATIVFRRTPCP